MQLAGRELKKVFIANRGEIARRIGIAAHEMGIATATLTARTPPPAFLAGHIDDFIVVQEESPSLYLNAGLMVQLAVNSGCDCVHPGFGFLSENAAFAEAVEAAGLTWIGPSRTAIQAMASKAHARDLAVAAGVPVVPGLEDLAITDGKDTINKALEFAAAVGYPLLVKAALGGGGKGMRLVTSPEQMADALVRASSEARASFGDGSIILEKYLSAPRHVEVQVLGDTFGKIAVIGDRDCSVQRRHQKIIEEAPAPYLNATTRAAMHQAARALAEAVGYSSAGTVEFLVDWSPEARADPKFYFLEMNTRLQVEHPVTEEVFGIDLVHWQFQIARGERLAQNLFNLEPNGHAVEARIYAEDTSKNFFPAPGPIYMFAPYHGPGLRWEVGIDSIDAVSANFDPMVAKLVVKGQDRAQALHRLASALRRTVFFGPANNIALLGEIADDSIFRDQAVTTHYINEHQVRLAQQLTRKENRYESLRDQLFTWLASGGSGFWPWAVPTLAPTERIYQGAAASNATPNIIITQQKASRGSGVTTTLGRGLVTTSETGYLEIAWAESKTADGPIHFVQVAGCPFQRRITNGDNYIASQRESASQAIVAPVPGKVIAIAASEGQPVAKGATVLVLESMKMEFEVQSPKPGIIGELRVKVGDQVNADDLLATWQVAEDG